MKKRDDVLVGIVMAAAIIVAIVGSLWLARGGLSKGYPLYAKFPWNSGLKQGQPVLLAGVNVGYVDEVELRQDGTVLTTFRVGKKYKVPAGTVATVVANGIFGDMAIALTPKGPNPNSIPAEDTVPVGPSAPGIAQITSKADSVATSVNAITTALNKELIAAGGIQDLRKTLASTNALTLNMNRLVSQFSSIAAEQNRQLSLTQASLRRATSGIDSSKIDSTLSNLRTTSANMATLTSDFRVTSMKLDSLLTKANSGTGSIGLALNDPGAYNDVRALIQHMDSLMADIKKNPRKYINLTIF
ncbi:MAG TPA: MlaD family protein [Gemmatimonadaceae bacterium]|jgi:phospholipid/cholesterol/gamma-HCH transport system substrate-binding protein|nr:MlaD family protein [Gemmatimonadaceae bacterium]